MNRFSISFVLLLSVVATIAWATTTTPALEPASHLYYKGSDDGCDYLTEPCSPLNDVWGYVDKNDKKIAIVGMANGVDFVDVSDPENPKRITEKHPITGCLTEWRDMKTYKNALYVVSDSTDLCECEEQPCELYVKLNGANYTNYPIRASEGDATAPLEDFDTVTGELVYPDTNRFACEPFQENFTGKVVLVDRGGNCMFSDLVMNVQNTGAIAILVANYRQDIIYPSMYGDEPGDIPGVMIGSQDRELLIAALNDVVSNPELPPVTISLSAEFLQNNPIYQPPDGFIIADLSDISNVVVKNKTREWFDFAHNILVDPERPYLYACGTDRGEGGVLVFDITQPFNPVLIAQWDVAYIHDMQVQKRPDGQWVMYGCGIYNSTVYILDVTTPHSVLEEVSSFTTLDSPHNAAVSDDGFTLYITHEEDMHPVTIWNCTDLFNIVQVGQFDVNADQGTIPHNAMINENLLWMSYYSEGVIVYNITDAPHPAELSRYDTSPNFTSSYHGVWGVYPYDPAGNLVYASDIETGLWVLRLVGDGFGDSSNEGGNGGTITAILIILFIALGVIVAISLAVLGFFLYRKYKRTQVVYA